MSKNHNHGAARSGKKSEERMGDAAKAAGLERWHLMKHFEGKNHDYEGTYRFKKPAKYIQAVKKRTNHFESDGLVVNPMNDKGAIVETKAANGHGTTEEKVFYDLYKIEDGIYGVEYPLVYLFQGPICESVNEYRLFADEVERKKLPVHVIFDPTPDLSRFKRFMRKLLA
jgi:hypothetical protein